MYGCAPPLLVRTKALLSPRPCLSEGGGIGVGVRVGVLVRPDWAWTSPMGKLAASISKKRHSPSTTYLVSGCVRIILCLSG
jgi:hypothetical protein